MGGSAGGGKSDLILGLAKTAHANSLIIRPESTQLSGFKLRVEETLMPGDRWANWGGGGILRTYDGRRAEFTGCGSFSEAVKKFRGRAHDLKAWDEVPTTTEDVFTFVNAWNRTTIPGQRCRVVATGNPPSRPEEEWVLDYWKPWLRDSVAEPGEIRYFIRGKDNKWVEVEDGRPIKIGKELVEPKSRTFIPARLEDNPILEKQGYRQTLLNMPEPFKSQLLYGDMKIGLTDDARQLIPTEWVNLAFRRWTDKPPKDTPAKCFSCDVARGGLNRAVFGRRYGNWVAPLLVIPGREVPEGNILARKVTPYIDTIYAPFVIDLTGTGGGDLHATMKLLHPAIPTYGFVAAAASKYTDRSGRIKMRNKRTEAYWRLRDALDPIHGIDLMLPPGDELRMELCAGKWYMFSSGAGLEDKDEIEKRLGGHSPDLADAVALLFMDVDATAGWISNEPGRSHVPFMGAELTPPDDKLDKYERAEAIRNGYRDPWS